MLVACSNAKQSEQAADSSRLAGFANNQEASPTKVSSDSATALAILDSLTLIAPPGNDAFDASRAPHFSADLIASFVSDSGLTLNDINRDADSTIHLSPAAVREQLTSRHGRAFEQLVHLAYIAGQPYPQYSQLTLNRSPGALVVCVSDWYVLTFINENGRVKLRRVDYRQLEGE